jgi:hypothetical protein
MNLTTKKHENIGEIKERRSGRSGDNFNIEAKTVSWGLAVLIFNSTARARIPSAVPCSPQAEQSFFPVCGEAFRPSFSFCPVPSGVSRICSLL